MKAIWELIQCTILAIITYACKTWNANKREIEKINRIMDNILKRVLRTPQSTPREALYIDTGLLDPQTISMKQTIIMDHRLATGNSNRLSRLVQAEGKQSWKELTDLMKTRLEITEEDSSGKPETVKYKIRKKARTYFKRKLVEDGQSKSKVQFLINGKGDQWEAGKTPQYMNELTRESVSIIFKTRTRMIDVKNNFRNKYPDLLCRACSNEPETQEHVLEEFTVLHQDDTSRVKAHEVFEEAPLVLKSTARKVSETLQKLSEISPVITPNQVRTARCPPQTGRAADSTDLTTTGLANVA